MGGMSEALDGTHQLDQGVRGDVLDLCFFVGVIWVEIFCWKVQVIIRGQIWGIASGEVWISSLIVIIEGGATKEETCRVFEPIIVWDDHNACT